MTGGAVTGGAVTAGAVEMVAVVAPPAAAVAASIAVPRAARRIDARCHVPLFTTARSSGELSPSLVAVVGSFRTTAVPVLGGMR